MHEWLGILLPALLIAAGLFTVVCALKGYRFFWEHRKAQFMVRIIGHTGAKFFYVTIGFALIVVGVAMAAVGFEPGKF